MNAIPAYISVGFVLTVLVTVYFFYKATNQSKVVVIVLFGWLLLQSLIGYSEFYVNTEEFPPRFLLLVLPPLLTIISLFVFSKGRQFIDGLDQKTLTFLHTIRIPMELVLYGLFVYGAIPEIMTFEGRNFDILAGLSAPFVSYYGFRKPSTSVRWKLIWNVVCLALLLNIVVHAILSAPFPFQQFAFEQPNRAVLYFPYNLLPGLVVPLVMLSHLTCIRRLLVNKDKV